MPPKGYWTKILGGILVCCNVVMLQLPSMDDELSMVPSVGLNRACREVH